jgi:hypothetical protein
VAIYDCPGAIDTDQIVTTTYSASMTFDTVAGSIFQVTATNGTAFAFNAPAALRTGAKLRVTLTNTSGGALGAITPNAVFKLAGAAWPSPATGFSRTIEFVYNGANFIEQWRSATDIPN